VWVRCVVLLIDNYDSFTFNLVHAMAAVRPDMAVRVVRNDELSAAAMVELAPSHLIISPGPCGPMEAGESMAAIRALAGRAPILGVCLGHQCIAAAFGMSVVRGEPRHGKTSVMRHDGLGVFAGLPDPMVVMRYHSLRVEEATVGEEWAVSAWVEGEAGEKRTIMGLRRERAGEATVEGVQFHPESFLTEHGEAMVGRFLGLDRGGGR